MCEDSGMETLKQVFRSETMQFLEVQGMIMNGTAVNVLVTPIIPPVNPMPPLQAPPAPETQAPEAEPAAE